MKKQIKLNEQQLNALIGKMVNKALNEGLFARGYKKYDSWKEYGTYDFTKTLEKKLCENFDEQLAKKIFEYFKQIPSISFKIEGILEASYDETVNCGNKTCPMYEVYDIDRDTLLDFEEAIKAMPAGEEIKNKMLEIINSIYDEAEQDYSLFDVYDYERRDEDEIYEGKNINESKLCNLISNTIKSVLSEDFKAGMGAVGKRLGNDFRKMAGGPSIDYPGSYKDTYMDASNESDCWKIGQALKSGKDVPNVLKKAKNFLDYGIISQNAYNDFCNSYQKGDYEGAGEALCYGTYSFSDGEPGNTGYEKRHNIKNL